MTVYVCVPNIKQSFLSGVVVLHFLVTNVLGLLILSAVFVTLCSGAHSFCLDVPPLAKDTSVCRGPRRLVNVADRAHYLITYLLTHLMSCRATGCTCYFAVIIVRRPSTDFQIVCEWIRFHVLSQSAHLRVRLLPHDVISPEINRTAWVSRVWRLRTACITSPGLDRSSMLRRLEALTIVDS